MTNSARLGDRNRRYCSARFIDPVYRDSDSLGIRLWRGAGRRPASRLLHSAEDRRSTSHACVDYYRGHGHHAGLEENPFAQHGLACSLHTFWYPAGSFAFDEQSSNGGQGRVGCNYHRVLRLLFDRPHTARTAARQPRVASSLWILRRRAWRSLWNEWAAARHLWVHATLVSAAFSRHPTRLFSPRQHDGDGWLLARRTLGSRCLTLLFSVAASRCPSRVPG